MSNESKTDVVWHVLIDTISATDSMHTRPTDRVVSMHVISACESDAVRSAKTSASDLYGGDWWQYGHLLAKISSFQPDTAMASETDWRAIAEKRNKTMFDEPNTAPQSAQILGLRTGPY